MTKRLSDEELAELERVCESRATRRAGDSFAYDSDVVFGGLASLVAEVRELRAAVSTEARINVAQLAELYELRAFKAQVERVKACPGDTLDECVNGARATLGTRGIDGACVRCGGLPDCEGEK